MLYIADRITKPLAIYILCIIFGFSAGCSSYKINVKPEPTRQPVNKPANMKFCIRSVEFKGAEDKSDNKFPNYSKSEAENNAMLLEDLKNTSPKIYSDLFENNKESIPLKIKLILTKSICDDELEILGGLTLGIFPVYEQYFSEYTIEVYAYDDNINKLLSEPIIVKRDETVWTSYFTPLGWIPVPGGTGERVSGGDADKKTKEKMTGACIEATAIALRRIDAIAWQKSNCKTLAQLEVFEAQEKLKGKIPYLIGERGPAGGWIFYDKGNNDNGWRYLEAAPENQSDAIAWSTANSSLISSTGTSVGDGISNTKTIINKLGNGNYAARICANYTFGNKKDWFLPSQEELDLMLKNLGGRGLGNLDNGRYWSSSETDDLFAKSQNFSNGFQGSVYKENTRKVRAIRAFKPEK